MSEETQKTDLFIGAKKVSAYTQDADLNIVGVLFEDNTSANYTISQFESVKSETAYPENLVSTRCFDKAIQEVLELIVAVDNSKEASENKIRAIMDVLMRERCNLNSYQWFLDQVENRIHTLTEEVNTRVKQSYRSAVCKVFDVPASEGIMLSQLHSVLTEETKAPQASV